MSGWIWINKCVSYFYYFEKNQLTFCFIRTTYHNVIYLSSIFKQHLKFKKSRKLKKKKFEYMYSTT